MRVRRIELTNFRAFPSAFSLPLGDAGKNLLLFGENGSGKSSLYRALKEAIRPANPTEDWNVFSNVFVSEEHPLVSLKIQTTTGETFNWQEGQPRPSNPVLIDAARRAGFLDYRSLLRLSYCRENSDFCELAFSIAVEELVPQFAIPLSGGTERTVEQLWKEVNDHPPKSRRQSHLDRAGYYTKRFSQAFSSVLPQFTAKVGARLKLRLEFGKMTAYEVSPESLPAIAQN